MFGTRGLNILFDTGDIYILFDTGDTNRLYGIGDIDKQILKRGKLTDGLATLNT
jgi:hypothetical protein